jgi:hypothetical protein
MHKTEVDASVMSYLANTFSSASSSSESGSGQLKRLRLSSGNFRECTAFPVALIECFPHIEELDIFFYGYSQGTAEWLLSRIGPGFAWTRLRRLRLIGLHEPNQEP